MKKPYSLSAKSTPFKVYVRTGKNLVPDGPGKEFVSVNQARPYAARLSRGSGHNGAVVIFNWLTGEWGPIYKNGKQLEWRYGLFQQDRPLAQTNEWLVAERDARRRSAKAPVEVFDEVHGFTYKYVDGCEAFDHPLPLPAT